jgi:hypothetical protein
MPHPKSLPFLLLAWALSACTLPQPILPTGISTPTMPVSTVSDPLPSTPLHSTPISSTLVPYTPGPLSTPGTASSLVTPNSIPPSPTRYDLTAEFDYAAHSLSVTEMIRYTNQAYVALPDLLLVIPPLDWQGSFQLASLTWENGAPITDSEIEGSQLRIPLSQPLDPGTEIGLQLSYQLNLPQISSFLSSQRPLPYGYTERQTNLVDWYPFLPPYRPGQGWLAHQPALTGENLVYDVADYQVQLTLAQPVPGLVIAASAPAAQDGLTYSFTLPAARTFVLSASPYYQVLVQSVGETTVYSYFFPYNAAAGREVLDATTKALVLYNELLGHYPRSSLSAVVADFEDGMEYSGLYFISRDFYEWYDGTPRGFLTLIAAHETAHQWWFDQVGNDQALEPWLDEALCTYMERLFYESMDAEEPPQDAQPFVDWWWYFRVDLYAPTGSLNSTIYDYSSFRAYRDAIYLRGAQFLEALRQQMGEEAFFVFLRAYATEMNGQLATSADFFRLLGEYTPDISSLKEIYFSP